MYIEELVNEEVRSEKDEIFSAGERSGSIVASDAKMVLIGAGARALFYPTLLYNVVRNKLQTEFRWWDRVDEFILLGAVPFPTDVIHLKNLGVCGVVTLNEPYETLVPTSLYQDHGIEHLVLPTRDYCFAPSLDDIYRAVDFIHKNASRGETTYVHCKAGRGRSTTIVICYLVKHKQMTPDDAYDYVRSIRPRVLLASSQWQAVQDFYRLHVTQPALPSHTNDLMCGSSMSSSASQDFVAFDDGSVVVITESDLDGYDHNHQPGHVRRELWEDVSVGYKVRVAGQSALARISCLWVGCGALQQKRSRKDLSREGSCSMRDDHMGGISVDIHVY